MDVREKLVELLTEFYGCDPMYYDVDALAIAQHLIANGVTVQEWISVAERLPEEEGWYLVYTTPNRGHKSINKAMFCKGYAWGNFEPYWRGAGGHWANVTHWMPLPQPAEGE